MPMWPIVLDCICWTALVVCMFKGPIIVTKIAVTFLAAYHCIDIIMLYRRISRPSMKMQKVSNNWDN